MNRLIQSKAVSAHMPPASGNMIFIAFQMLGKDFTAFPRPAEVNFVAQLMAPHLPFDHDLEKVKVLEFRADGHAPLEQCTSFEAIIRPMLDVPGVDSVALRQCSEGGESFPFLTSLVLSPFYSLIPSHLYRANLNG